MDWSRLSLFRGPFFFSFTFLRVYHPFFLFLLREIFFLFCPILAGGGKKREREKNRRVKRQRGEAAAKETAAVPALGRNRTRAARVQATLLPCQKGRPVSHRLLASTHPCTAYRWCPSSTTVRSSLCSFAINVKCIAGGEANVSTHSLHAIAIVVCCPCSRRKCGVISTRPKGEKSPPRSPIVGPSRRDYTWIS